jgi:hypothetical protein
MALYLTPSLQARSWRIWGSESTGALEANPEGLFDQVRALDLADIEELQRRLFK